MTINDRMEILRRAVERHGQAEVARIVGCSDSYISQLKNGKLANPEPLLERVVAAFGATTVDCPVLGNDTPLADCLDARARADRPLVVSSGQAVKLYRACQDCPNKGGVK